MKVFVVAVRGCLATAAFVAQLGFACTPERIQMCIDTLQSFGISEETSTRVCTPGANFPEEV